MEITGKFMQPMPRQNNEGVRIDESQADIVLNSRAEWDQPPIVRLVPMRGNRLEDQVGATTGLVPRQETQDRGQGTGALRQRTPNRRGRGRGRGGGRGAAVTHSVTIITRQIQTRSQSTINNS
jgi:hypothetical protein